MRLCGPLLLQLHLITYSVSLPTQPRATLIMSSPLAPAEEVGDIAVDEEMTNAVDQPPSPLPNGTQDHSSSTMDHDYNPQPETQPSQSAPHHNRKDATLREFLSKMDEYAPIVRYFHPIRSTPSPSCHLRKTIGQY